MEGDDAMKEEEHPVLHDVPIGIDATGQRHETDSMGGIDVPADPLPTPAHSFEVACGKAGKSCHGNREDRCQDGGCRFPDRVHGLNL
jgi:hypothetical protein